MKYICLIGLVALFVSSSVFASDRFTPKQAPKGCSREVTKEYLSLVLDAAIADTKEVDLAQAMIDELIAIRNIFKKIENDYIESIKSNFLISLFSSRSQILITPEELSDLKDFYTDDTVRYHHTLRRIKEMPVAERKFEKKIIGMTIENVADLDWPSVLLTLTDNDIEELRFNLEMIELEIEMNNQNIENIREYSRSSVVPKRGRFECMNYAPLD